MSMFNAKLQALRNEVEMNIKPTKRIAASNPYPQNPLGIQVYVADDEAREAVNKLSNEPFTKGDVLFNGPPIIKEGKYDGFFRMNPCFEMADVIEAIETALEA